MDFNGIIDAVLGQIYGVTGLIMTFFGALVDLNTAPVVAASGVSGLAASFQAIKDSLLGAIDTFKAE